MGINSAREPRLWLREKVPRPPPACQEMQQKGAFALSLRPHHVKKKWLNQQRQIKPDYQGRVNGGQDRNAFSNRVG